jgi:hypothetical protein
MNAKKEASFTIYLFWGKKTKKKKKKHRPLLRFCSCKCQNMISVTHFEILSLGGKNCLVRALLGTLESPMLRFTCYKQKAPLRYQSAIRASPAVCSQNSHPR